MVIDTSALMAILEAEPEAVAIAEAIERDPVRLVSAGSLLEASIVLLARRGDAGVRDLDLLAAAAQVDVLPFTREHALLGRLAYAQYGKGRHPAGLNLGDCFSYALSKASGEPLLFKGSDFDKTDVCVVKYRE